MHCFYVIFLFLAFTEINTAQGKALTKHIHRKNSSVNDIQDLETRFYLQNLPNYDCYTRLRDPGRCVSLKDCPVLSERVRSYDRMYIFQAVSDYICGFGYNVRVCCPENVRSQAFRQSDREWAQINERPYRDPWSQQGPGGPPWHAFEDDAEYEDKVSWGRPGRPKQPWSQGTPVNDQPLGNQPKQDLRRPPPNRPPGSRPSGPQGGSEDRRPSQFPDNDRRPSQFPDNNDRRPSQFPDNDRRPSQFTDNDRRPSQFPDNNDRLPSQTPGNDDRHPSQFPDNNDRRPSQFPDNNDRRPSQFPDNNDRRPSQFPGNNPEELPLGDTRKKPVNDNSNQGSSDPINHRNRKMLPTNCGADVMANKVLFGNNTALGEYPWVALVRIRTQGRTIYGCGGSLIHPRYVLTAAHCVRIANMPFAKVDQVRLGEHDTRADPDCRGVGEFRECSDSPQNIDVEQQIVHSGYVVSSREQANDIALLRLKTPAILSEYVMPICLPVDSTINYDDKSMWVAGWGRTSNNANSNSPIKQKVFLPVVPDDKCKSIYKNSAYNLNLVDTQMCAGGGKEDSCLGDSGGPLMSLDQSGATFKWFVRGVVSVGPNQCGTVGMPGIYTKVAKFIPWILDNIRP